jgi:hypothetical protein
MPQPAPADTASRRQPSPERHKQRGTAALAALGAFAAMVIAVLLLAGGGGDGGERGRSSTASGLPSSWRNGEAVVPAQWSTAPPAPEARPRRRPTVREVVAAPASAPVPVAAVPVDPAPVAPPSVGQGAVPLPPQPGEDFNWQR